MNQFKSNGYRTVLADSMAEAASIFAARAARKQYGKRGYVRTCTQQAYSQDGRLAEYSAFIGYTPRGEPHSTAGNNIQFTVTLAKVGAR